MSKTLYKLKKQEFKISAVLGVRLIQLQEKGTPAPVIHTQ